jgi:choline-sulfatase
LLRGYQQKPNVLFFMTDQESAMLPGPVNRPNRDSLRNRGVEFTHAFCNTPQCSPARGSLLTGLEPHRNGVVTNVDKTSLGKPLSPKLPTLGTVFKNAGYKTGYFGKWHLGGDDSGTLQPFGFSEYRPGSDTAAVESAAAWIKEQDGPWLAWVSILNPHHIYDFVTKRAHIEPRPGVRPPFTSRGELAGKPPAQQRFVNDDQGRPTLQYTQEDWIRYRSYYCDLVAKADQAFGVPLSAVKNLANTIVVYTSDHGDALGEHGLPFKGPFMYDPLIRVPLVIAAPGLKANSTRGDFVESIDLSPTVAGLAGLSWPAPVDGKDLSKNASGRDAVFLEYYSKQHWVAPIRTIRTKEWKLNQYGDGGTELYNLKNDAHEARNLAGQKPTAQVQQNLKNRLAKWWPPDGGL